MYRVIKDFVDLKDNSHPYRVGDVFPRSGKTASDKRIEELSTTANRQKTPLIEAVAHAIAPEDVEEDQTAEDLQKAEEVPQEDASEAADEEEAPKSKKKGKKR